MTDSMPEALFNPFDPDFAVDPYPQYARLRESAPVYEHPLGFWFVTGYDDVATLLRSRHSVEDRHVGDPSMREMVQSMYAGGGAPSIRGVSMLDRDPPDHTRLRRLVSKAFTPKAIAALRPKVERLVDRMLDDLAAAGSGNLITALSFPLPFAVITEMLGMPDTDTTHLRELTGMLVRSLEPVVDPETLTAIGESNSELSQLMADAIAWKRRNPGDDLLTALIEAEDDGDVLSDEELIAQVALLYIAGHETTVNLIGNGTLALLRQPEQFAAIRERPDVVSNAVDELLRFDSPVQTSRRVTLEPFELGGVEIPAGSFVMASLASANRDPAVWGSDAEVVDVDRPKARQHVSFGAGPHHCLGAALARLEGEVAFARLAARFPNLALDGDLRYNGRINLRGLDELPVAV